MRLLCRQCSEGHPHQEHDRNLAQDLAERRVVAIAARPDLALESVVGDWMMGGERRLISLRSGTIDRDVGGDPGEAPGG